MIDLANSVASCLAIGSIAINPVMWHVSIMSATVPAYELVFPGTYASACTVTNGASIGNEYSNSFAGLLP
eukprot:13071254-Ditylum_brightwellii.AAC.1